MCIVMMDNQSKLTPCNNVKIGNYIVGETLGCGTFGKVKRELIHNNYNIYNVWLIQLCSNVRAFAFLT